MWDGAVNHIEVQALAPISDKKEMGESIENVVKKLQAKKLYRTLFYKAFSDSTITGQNLLKAIAQFQLTLISAGSKYDQVKKGKIVSQSRNRRAMRFLNGTAIPVIRSHFFHPTNLPLTDCRWIHT
jgi:cytochrome c peroxidase